MLSEGLFTSRTQNWATPQEFFDRLNKEFDFTLDVCAEDWNAKCNWYITEEENGLRLPWHGRVFMNPPYGSTIGQWVEKAYKESQTNAQFVVCLIPARTDTRWWHNWVMQSAEIRFIKGRLSFSEFGTAPFPSVVVLFCKGVTTPILTTMLANEVIAPDISGLLDEDLDFDF